LERGPKVSSTRSPVFRTAYTALQATCSSVVPVLRAYSPQLTAYSWLTIFCNIWEKIQLTPEHFAILAFFFLNKTCTVIYQPLEKVPVITSFADPDPGSGIRCLFDTWIRDPD
jgi:hypothetical protein